MMLIKSALIVVTAVLVIVVNIQQTSFSLHDSNLDANTWIAQDNSTEVNTIDLNTPINQTVSGGAAAEPEPTSTPDDEGEDEGESTSDEEDGDEGDEETDEE